MTKEQKDLLLKDLCSRLPYGVKIHAEYIDTDVYVEKVGVLSMIDSDDTVIAFTCDDANCYNYVAIHEVKPYLLPLSSMTGEQRKEYTSLLDHIMTIEGDVCDVCTVESINWLLENHFDVNNLIPLGLAKDATGLNIY